MSKEAFRDRFGDDPRKDDLTVLAPKQDDPTDQVPSHKGLSVCRTASGKAAVLALRYIAAAADKSAVLSDDSGRSQHSCQSHARRINNRSILNRPLSQLG